MKVAFGLKAHSGWASLVVLGAEGGHHQVVDRRRMELIQAGEEWAKQPYHAAENLEAVAAREMVERGIEAARRNAAREMRAAAKRAKEGGHDVAACALVAEGVLFREALAMAATECELRLVTILEKELDQRASRALGAPSTMLRKRIAALGKQAGPPWGKDQKDAALAAMVSLQGGAK